MKQLSFFTFMLLLFFFMREPTAGGQSSAAGLIDPTASAGEEEGYRFSPGDAISVRFFYNPDFNVETQIRPDGRISLPVIGEISVSNLTIAELTSLLETLYKDILRRTTVTIQIINYANRKFFVGGEVQRPGMFLLAGRQTVLGAILEAGGMTKTAKSREVYLIRRTDIANATAIKISLAELPDQPSPAATFRIEPYDVVVVPESGIAQANRFVEQYIRQMLPMLLSGGFTYLLNSDGGITPR